MQPHKFEFHKCYFFSLLTFLMQIKIHFAYKLFTVVQIKIYYNITKWRMLQSGTLFQYCDYYLSFSLICLRLISYYVLMNDLQLSWTLCFIYGLSYVQCRLALHVPECPAGRRRRTGLIVVDCPSRDTSGFSEQLCCCLM